MNKALLLVLLGCLAGSCASISRGAPGWSEVVNTDPHAGITIELTSPFAQVPSRGYIPCVATIKNHSGGARAWTFQLSSSSGYSSLRNEFAAEQSARVENDHEARVPLLLPVVPKASVVYAYRSALVHTTGYGVVAEAQNTFSTSYRDPKNGTETPFIGMSAKLAKDFWSSLEEELKSRTAALVGSPLDLSLLPPDWRALTGVQCLWLTPEEYAGLDVGQQAAIKDWVGYGGSLFVCEATPDPSTRTVFGVHDPAGKPSTFGFGDVQWIAYDGKKLDVHDTANRLSDAARLASTDPSLGDAQDWGLAKTVGPLKLDTAFLMIFIGAFAVIIGPVNLFRIAPQGRRHRLFWTTPLISLAASFLLVAVIVLQDGFGGSGSRVVLTFLLPGQNEAVMKQEQVSRTGVLFGRSFQAREDLLLASVSVKTVGGHDYNQSGRFYGGDWYASRSLQAQRAEAILPTRARIDLLNAEQASAGAPPVVVSSLPAELTELRYRDAAGKSWKGHALRTGERQTLQPDAGSPLVSRSGGSGYLDDLLHKVQNQPGNFCAVASKGQFIDTLPSIRWTDERAIILGPVTINR